MHSKRKHPIARHTRSIFVLASFALLLIFPATNARAFCENRADGSKCHQEIVRESLPFLRSSILETIVGHVNDPDDNGFLGLDYSSDDHFDSCNFDGGTDRINDRYLEDYIPPSTFGAPVLSVVSNLSPLRQNLSGRLKDRPWVFPAAERWSHILHAAQDFYSHSNWVEMNFANPSTDLVDRQLGAWRELPSDWGAVRGNVIASQQALPSGWRIDYPTSVRVPVVTTSSGAQRRLLVSGLTSVTLPSNTCPVGARIHHDALNKDNISRPLYSQALAMAFGQTRHEWCRLLHLSRARNGWAGAAVPLGLWVKSNGSPHPIGTACAQPKAGPIEVNLRVSRIKVLNDHEDSDSGQINFALTLFSDDFQRSARSQSGETRVNSGAFVPQGALPAPVKLCVNAAERVVGTLQAWENDGSSGRGELTSEDDLFSGATRAFGTAGDLMQQSIHLPITASSDNSSNQDLEVTFEVSASMSTTCQPQVLQN